jgi:DNA mismatch endonuclease, patch repair protein
MLRPKHNLPWPDVPETRRRTMSAIRAKNTMPEVAVRSLLHKMGYRFKLHTSSLPGHPDIAFKQRRKVVFVHGCFWHYHRECSSSRIPRTRSEFWAEKLQNNRDRDERTIAKLRSLGWEAVVVWECELKDPHTLKRVLQEFLGPPKLGHTLPRPDSRSNLRH